MDAQDRKLNLRITRRKTKVQRLIAEQEACLVALGTMPDREQHRQKHLQSLSSGRNKLYRLKQELLVLESGRLLQEI
jgi:hypothetical protein